MTDLLGAAVRHHRQGRPREAESLYRRVLRDEPDNAEALHLLGLLAHEAGHHRPAEELILRAIGVNPRKAVYRFNLGVVRAARADAAGAERAYREALSLQPDHADAHNNLGLLLEKRGGDDAALDCYRLAARHGPRHAEARVNLGRGLLAAGKPAAARRCFERALALQPGLAEAHFGLGKSLEEQDEWEEAEASYGRALDLRPRFPEALNNLAAVLLARGDYGRARETFAEVARLRRGESGASVEALTGPPSEAGAAAPLTKAGAAAPLTVAGAAAPLRATRFLLLDRLQQLEYLLAEGRIDPSFREVAGRIRGVLGELDAQGRGDGTGFDWRRALEPGQARRIGRVLDRTIHCRDAPRVAGPAVNPDLDFAGIEAAYLSSPAPAVVLDELLTPAALEGLRRFCRESTIFFGADPAGYVSAYLADGFNCSLMYQIAEELKARFARVLGPHHLSNMWAYRHVAESGGVTAHTDLAAVTFNFWITPEAANLDPDAGGLIVHRVEEPLDWDWLETNRKKNAPEIRDRIARHLESAERLVVPYRGNRAVMFHSNLFHQSDRIRFRDSFEDRRVNVSLLFGRRASSDAGAPPPPTREPPDPPAGRTIGRGRKF